jgi:hypothetical protein
MVNYYPETLTVAKLRASTGYKWDLLDAAEVQRLEDIEFNKARGKGTPKKAKNAGASLNISIPIQKSLIAAQQVKADGRVKGASMKCYTVPFFILYYRILLSLDNSIVIK